jgi:hypothetical protein
MAHHDQTDIEDEDLESLREQGEATSGTDTEHVIYEEGFTGRTIIGALFVAFVMLPGAIYLGLVSGASLGSASEWVTIVLFAEVARRSFIPLKRQEIYVLFYIAAALSGLNAAIGVAGGPFGNLIWTGYSTHIAPQATGTPVTIHGVVTTVSRAVPTWAVPAESSPVWTQRTFLHPDWLIPIGLLLVGSILDKISQITAGYCLFRLTSDIERLPFPMAPVNAAGATALAEAGSKEESWRWRVFSIGAMAGIIFGFFYLGIPIFTGTVLPTPLKLLPLPFWDATPNTEGILPGAATGLSFDLTNVLVGFVLPLPMLVGSAITSLISQLVVNPFLYNHQMLPTYRKGANAVWTKMATDLDFWMSVDIGLKLAVALIGIWMAAGILARYFRSRSGAGPATGTSAGGAMRTDPPPGRGDFDWKKGLILFFICQVVFIIMGHKLVPQFPLAVLIGLGFIYQPLISYVSARMFGLTGQGVGLPYLNEAINIRTGYKGIDVWFMPKPMADYGHFAQRFREVELTGTKFTSIIKAEAFVLPLILVASFLYWAFLWHTSAIPSSQFPYAQLYWPVHVNYRVLWMSATTEGQGKAVQQFLHAIQPSRIVVSMVAGIVAYGAISALKLPVLFFYGAVGGVGQMMHGTVPALTGGLLGRYYFARRFGLNDWRRYSPVLLAGFSCGMGLIAMVAIALGLITKSVSFLPF